MKKICLALTVIAFCLSIAADVCAGGYVYEDFCVVGRAEIRETFTMYNLGPAPKTDRFDFFNTEEEQSRVSERGATAQSAIIAVPQELKKPSIIKTSNHFFVGLKRVSCWHELF